MIGWSAPALHLKARDQSLEWTVAQRQARLHLLAQNSRFVILGDRQQLPNLATRAMARCLGRLSSDWQQAYGHPIVLVESFVDRQRFRGTAYKAGGWEALGYSSGFKRVSEDFYQRHDRPKELWVKALDWRAWNWLRAERLPAPLARYQKPVSPACPVAGKAVASLWERFERVPEWRQPNGKRHQLPTVLTIIALACLAGVGQGYRAVSRFARRLTREQGRWGIQTRNHYPLDVTHREDESRVRHRNAASVLGLLRRLSNTFPKLWSQGRPPRQATARDWIEENQFNRWLGIRLFTRPATTNIRASISHSSS